MPQKFYLDKILLHAPVTFSKAESTQHIIYTCTSVLPVTRLQKSTCTLRYIINAVDWAWHTLRWDRFICWPSIDDVHTVCWLVWVDVSLWWSMRSWHVCYMTSTDDGERRRNRIRCRCNDVWKRRCIRRRRNSLQHVTGIICQSKQWHAITWIKLIQQSIS